MPIVEKTISFGNNAGEAFPEYNTIRSVAFASGIFIDRIIINGDSYGGPGGTLSETLVLAENEWIESVTLRSGDVIDSLRLTSNTNKSIHGGGQGGRLHCALVHGRVLSISGMVGYWHGFNLPVICRLTFKVLMPDPPPIKDDCSPW